MQASRKGKGISAQSDARVNQRRKQVSDEVSENDKDRGNRRDTYDDGKVERLNGLPHQLADARPAKDILNDDHPRHEYPDIQPDHGNDRQNGIAEPMDQGD